MPVRKRAGQGLTLTALREAHHHADDLPGREQTFQWPTCTMYTLYESVCLHQDAFTSQVAQLQCQMTRRWVHSKQAGWDRTVWMVGLLADLLLRLSSRLHGQKAEWAAGWQLPD